MPAEISAKTGVNRLTISTMARRNKWPDLKRELASKLTSEIKSKIQAETVRDLARESALVREELSSEAQSQLALLRRQPATKVSQLANSGQGRAAVLKTVAETARIAFGWGGENQSNIQINVLNKLEPKEMSGSNPDQLTGSDQKLVSDSTQEQEKYTVCTGTDKTDC